MKDEIQDRLTQEVSRKQFLQLMGAALLAVFGFSNLINLLLGKKNGHNVYINQHGQASHGFGSSKFGV